MNSIEDAIREGGFRLGYRELKSEQIMAISSFVQGNDTFVALPTGYGKSLIYAVLPFVFDVIRGIFYLLVESIVAGFIFQEDVVVLWCV